MIFLVLCFFAFLLLLCAGFIYLFYWVPKVFGYLKLGKILASTAGVCLLTLVFSMVFEDQLFSKNDAKKLLAEVDIRLTDPIQINENKSMAAIGDYYHIFRLSISQKDKQIISQQIKNAPNFKGIGEHIEDIQKLTDRYKGKKVTQNYETESCFVRKSFEPNGEGYAPTYFVVTINKEDNELTFEDIDE